MGVCLAYIIPIPFLSTLMLQSCANCDTEGFCLVSVHEVPWFPLPVHLDFMLCPPPELATEKSS